jgi:rRNA maturation endonuclease Nob1
MVTGQLPPAMERAFRELMEYADKAGKHFCPACGGDVVDHYGDRCVEEGE